jgi:hypothetical protein
MKSIKEKAIEVFPEHCNFYTNSCNERKRIGFEAGANYVLECFELYCKEHVVCNTNIKHLIEQLKK